MKSIKVVYLILIILMLISLFGCASSNVKNTESVTSNTRITESVIPTSQISASPSPTYSTQSTASATSTIQSNNEEYQILNEQFLNKEIMDGELKLADITGLLKLDNKTLKDNFGDIELIGTGGRFDEFYEDYKNIELGLHFICYRTGGVKYIELDKDKFSLDGINKLSSFKDVKGVLGNNIVCIVENALPSLKRYELVYKCGDSFLRIYAFDEEGESGLYFCVTDEFEAKYSYMEITPELISRYFRMTKGEIKTELGEADESYSDELRYDEYGIVFKFNEGNTKLAGINLSSIYQINGLRQDMTPEETIKIMGEGKKTEKMTSEDGPLTIYEYKYNNFILDVCYLLMEDQVPWWDIKTKS